MELPRLEGSHTATRKTCAKCPKPYVKGAWAVTKEIQWQDTFTLFEPGNPFGAVICGGCSSASPPPGHKWCRTCRCQRPEDWFKGGRKRCKQCRKRARERHWEKTGKNARSKRFRKFTEEDDEVMEASIAANLTLKQIEAVSTHLLCRFHETG